MAVNEGVDDTPRKQMSPGQKTSPVLSSEKPPLSTNMCSGPRCSWCGNETPEASLTNDATGDTGKMSPPGNMSVQPEAAPSEASKARASASVVSNRLATRRAKPG